MIKLGFLGGGVDSIAGRVHLIASEMDRKFKVIGGIFSKNKEKSKKSAKKYGIKHFDNLEEMANEVDIIVILTPTPMHYNNLQEVLKYNVGVIVDKPLLTSTKEATDLNFKDKFVVVTHNYSGYPLVREMKALYENKILGEIKKIKINMAQESFFKPLKENYPQEWRKKDYSLPTIVLDLGVHTYHLAKFILNKSFEPIFYEKNSFSKLNVVDDVICIAKGANFLVELSFSKVSLGNINPLFIEVYGDNAGVKWMQDDFENLYISYKSGQKEIINRSNAKFEANKKRYQRMAPGHPGGFIDAFANLYCDIYDAFIEFKQKKIFDNKFIFDYKHSLESLEFFEKGEKLWEKLKTFYMNI
jgi:predicted dehydrogenase